MQAGNSAGFVLPDDQRAPGQARDAVRATLIQWRLRSLIDDAVLAASELVTNALHHGLPPIHLLLRRSVDQLRIDVGDARPETFVAMDKPADLQEYGRGLAIVRNVSDDRGSEHMPNEGKRVYASWHIVDLSGEPEPAGQLETPKTTTR